MDPSSSGIVTTSPWPNLPSDILITIATLLSPKIGFLRLRSVCHPWRATLSATSPPPFSLSVPSPIRRPPTEPPLSLLQQTFYLLTPPATAAVTATSTATANPSFLLHLQQPSQNKPNTFSFITPFSSKPSLKPIHPLNLFNYGITPVCHSYAIENSAFFRRIAVSEDGHGGVVVMGLTAADGKLLVWKHGGECWTPITHKVRTFDDVVSYNGKFYATADKSGRLLMIDPEGLKVIDIVSSIMYGCGSRTSLVGCEAGLYLVDRVCVGRKLERFEVFKLDEKGRFWDYECHLNDGVFFFGDHANLSISSKDYHGDVRNVIYFVDSDDITKVWDMKKSAICRLVDNEEYRNLFWPPSSCFNGM